MNQKFRLTSEYQSIVNEGFTLRQQAQIILQNPYKLKQLPLQIVCRQYSRGGEVLHRGYYCPSPILDLVIGNGNRGRLLKNMARCKNAPSFEYGFNADDELIYVQRNPNVPSHEPCIEYILWEDSKSIGYYFESTDWLSVVSECVYNEGKILSYLSCSFIPKSEYELELTEIHKETYQYQNGLLACADMYRYMSVDNTVFEFPTSNDFDHEQYVFQHDSDGYISSYMVKEYKDGKENKNYVWRGHVFTPLVHRKI